MPGAFMCPIGHEVMRDPVLAGDGFSYERTNIARWIRRFPEPLRARSPCTNLVMPHHTLVPNHSLRAAISEWAAMTENSVPTAAEGRVTNSGSRVSQRR
jgi:hypothetical protein